MPTRAQLLAAGMLVVLGCAPEPATGPLVSELTPGLALRGAVQAERDGHLVEIRVHDGYAYVANSQGVVTLQLEPGGGMTLVDNGKAAAAAAAEFTSCTSLAIHPATDTLYCGSDGPAKGEARIERYDLADPEHPALSDDPLWITPLWGVRSIEVVGDRLLINAFDDGLWTAMIGPDGQLGELDRTPVEGNIRFCVAVGEVLVGLFADLEGPGTELRVLDPDSFAVLDQIGLDGPPLGLSADADGAPRVAVALGSGGMALVDLDPETHQLTLADQLQPPAVVSHALVSAEIAVAVTLSGAFAWDLDDRSSGTPRLFGFGPESTGNQERGGNMLHAVFYEGELLTSDWTWVQRWSFDPTGESLALDVPRGVYLAPTGPAAWRLRNPGNVTLRAEHWAGSRHLFDVEVEPGEVETVKLSAIQRMALLPAEDASQTVALRIHDPSVVSAGTPVSTSTLMLLQRDPDDPIPPAVGEPFPSLVLADADYARFDLPLARPTQLIWYSPDCALMWPELEDLAWIVRSGVDTGRGDPVFIAPNDPNTGFARRWGLESVESGLYGFEAPEEIDQTNASLGTDDLLELFVIVELPGEAMVSDYVLDADGAVRSIERMYRGRWSLAEPGPWPGP